MATLPVISSSHSVLKPQAFLTTLPIANFDGNAFKIILFSSPSLPWYWPPVSSYLGSCKSLSQISLAHTESVKPKSNHIILLSRIGVFPSHCIIQNPYYGLQGTVYPRLLSPLILPFCLMRLSSFLALLLPAWPPFWSLNMPGILSS